MWFRDDHAPISKIGKGSRFKYNDSVYLLAQCEPGKLCLISMHDGNRWAPPVEVEDPMWVSKNEFSEITSGYLNDFILISLRMDQEVSILNARLRNDNDKVGMGSTFVNDSDPNDVYILSQVDVRNGRSLMALISVKGGNRWATPIEVVTPSWISRMEWDTITDGEMRFRKVEILVTLA